MTPFCVTVKHREGRGYLRILTQTEFSKPLLTFPKLKLLILVNFFPEMTVILRDRINDLLTANAELEREVARLRYAPIKVDAEQHPDPEISLEQTRYCKAPGSFLRLSRYHNHQKFRS